MSQSMKDTFVPVKLLNQFVKVTGVASLVSSKHCVSTEIGDLKHT